MTDTRRTRRFTAAEREKIREVALEQMAQDFRNDERFAIDTVCALADELNKPDEWWLEMMTTDEDMWEELLGFDPFEET